MSASKKQRFNPVSSIPSFPEIEAARVAYWKKNKIFEKSLNLRAKSPHWTFLDGPPFITGMPHYGTLLSSIPKDVFGRYKTMKGYYVRRVWGWDGHGLPIENKVEGELKLTRKKDIEETVGVARFIEECKKYVNDVSEEWEWYVDRIGRWVDFNNAYKTWGTDYMESVMWVFKTMYDKGYIYKGLRVSLFCCHCVTPISNFEVAMDADNYKEITEPSTIYKFKVRGEKDTYFLAWSTTPWNKMVTTALAVNPKLTYVKVKLGVEYLILAKSTLKILKSEDYRNVDTFLGSKLLGMSYEPLYDFFTVQKDKKAFIVAGGDFVSSEEGTGIVTIAPYGEDDLKLMQRDNIHVELHVDEEGIMKEYVPHVAGLSYRKANEKIDAELDSRGLIFRIDQYTHTVPTCWRCHTRLYYAPQNAWYVDVAKLKPKLIAANEAIHWVPSHFKYGRFLKSMEAAPDWCISRSRYWGSPVPVWECECGERFVPGSIAELEKRSGVTITDLHKPGIDDVVVTCTTCGKKAYRVSEVLDSWIEAGSASFAERHFPFNTTEKLSDFFPPDFISEYTGQIRAWFYVLHVIGVALYDSIAFKNVLVSGVILGNDGRKMSKNFKNYPDPKEMLEKHGGDALRLYLLGSPVMMGGDIAISEEEYRNQVKDTLLILWNSYNYFVLYANQHEWDPQSQITSSHILDQWIVGRLCETTTEVTADLDSYDTPKAVKALTAFTQDLSTWFIRRSRSRFVQGDTGALSTLYTCLVEFSRVAAPIIPFIADEIYTALTGKPSVHLENYPEVGQLPGEQQMLQKDMAIVRQIVSLGNAYRKKYSIGIRQPLASVTIHDMSLSSFKDELSTLIADELNVKSVQWAESKKNDQAVVLDTHITSDLRDEGEARSLVRKIQNLRKKQGCSLTQTIEIQAPSWPSHYEEYIKEKTLAIRIVHGDLLTITNLS